MSDYSNIPLGLKITTQIPLDVKTYIQNENALKDLGLNDNLAFTYVQGCTFYCIEEGTRYEWREVVGAEVGLRTLDYTYPADIIAFGITYSNKIYNFFPTTVTSQVNSDWNSTSGVSEILNKPTIPTIDGSETKLSNGSNVTITGNGTIGSPYVVNSSYVDTNTTYTAGLGVKLTGTVFSLDNNLQKTITASYTVVSADNNYTIIIDNGANPINITIPSGLLTNIFVGFIQKGTGDVTFVPSGTTIQNPIGLKSKGQYYNTSIDQEGASNVFYLLGNTKL